MTAMARDLPIRCACGKLRGSAHGLTADTVNYGICYCADCQAFARHLDRAAQTLDEQGGTRLCQLSPAQVEIKQGKDQLACIRLSDKGPLRWYASCCGTPLANTSSSHKLPFIGLIHTCLGADSDGTTLDQAVGPLRFRVFGRSAIGGNEKLGAHDKIPLSMFARVMTKVLGARLRGDHRKSAFFDTASGKPVARPHVLSADELERARGMTG